MGAEGKDEPRELDITYAEQLFKEMRSKVASGTHWYLALLEAVGKWKYSDEEVEKNHYRYLIGGEAFDWLLLAARLSQELDGAVTEEEKESLFFSGIEPLSISSVDFKNIIGPSKYKTFLNYYYGVEVEEALINAVEEEVWKEKKAMGFLEPDEEKITDEAFRRLYQEGFYQLFREYKEERGFLEKDTFLLYEWKEFVYWLFRLRCRLSDKARCASDTKKALLQIQKHRSASRQAISHDDYHHHHEE